MGLLLCDPKTKRVALIQSCRYAKEHILGAWCLSTLQECLDEEKGCQGNHT